MKTNNNIAKHIFVAGTIMAGSFLASASSLRAETLFNYNSVGTGSEMRTNLLDSSPNRNLELKCGNNSESKSEKKPASESKSKDAKCGEKKTESKTKDGKCGAVKADSSKASSKSKDGKCGEGKCGGSSAKKSSTDNSKKESTKK